MHSPVRISTIYLLIGDVIVFVGSLIVTLFLRYQEVPSQQIIEQHLVPFTTLFFIWVTVFLIAGFYDRDISLSRKSIPARVAKVQLINIVIAALFFVVVPSEIAPKTNLVIYLVVSSVFIAVWRLYLSPLITTGQSMQILLIGASEETVAIARVLAYNPYFKDVKVLMMNTTEYDTYEELESALVSFLDKRSTDLIIADMNDAAAQKLSPIFYKNVIHGEGAHFYPLPKMYEELHHRVPPSLINERWVLENISFQSPHYAYDFLKRTTDVVGAAILLLPSIILFPFIMAAIRYEDGGVFFYRAKRIGQFGKVIEILKFRTKNGTDTGADALNSTLVDTKVGTFLRKTRLDELPQLLNVLTGDLSFIGPRPEIPELANEYNKAIPYYHIRHMIKPGLSGWAQINNYDAPRGGVDVSRTKDKLSFDLYYLMHRSVLLDIEIALKTINTLLLRTGS